MTNEPNKCMKTKKRKTQCPRKSRTFTSKRRTFLSIGRPFCTSLQFFGDILFGQNAWNHRPPRVRAWARCPCPEFPYFRLDTTPPPQASPLLIRGGELFRARLLVQEGQRSGRGVVTGAGGSPAMNAQTRGMGWMPMPLPLAAAAYSRHGRKWRGEPAVQIQEGLLPAPN